MPAPPAAVTRDSQTPLYQQIADRLESDIKQGVLRVGSQLPTEPELMAMFGVSRVTIRLALRRLAERHLIVSRQGKGTFVAGDVVRHDLDVLQGFYDNLLEQGLQPRTELLEFRSGIALDGSMRGFVGSTATLAYLRRRYIIGRRPLALVSAYVAETNRPITRENAESYPIYGILQRVQHVILTRAEMSVRAAVATADIATCLGLDSGAPVLVMERVSFSSGGEPQESSRIHIVPELYEFRLNVSGPLPVTASIARADPPQAGKRKLSTSARTKAAV